MLVGRVAITAVLSYRPVGQAVSLVIGKALNAVWTGEGVGDGRYVAHIVVLIVVAEQQCVTWTAGFDNLQLGQALHVGVVTEVLMQAVAQRQSLGLVQRRIRSILDITAAWALPYV